MNGFLLDTNVLSELRKGSRCNSGVRNWFESIRSAELFVSVLVFGEIRQGIERLRPRDPVQAGLLEDWLKALVGTFASQILSVDQSVADQWGRLGLKRPAPPLDALLAATARVHGLAVVTRNSADFVDLGVQVVNPFSD